MRPDLFLATIGRGSNGSNALEVTEDRAAVTAESQDNIIDRVNNVSQYGPSWHYVPGIGVAGTAYAEVPGSALGDLAFSRASSKTRTNAAGVVETIASNVPPHDYRNADGTLSTFPRLNLEPQRTNSLFYSEEFDNAYFTKSNTSILSNVAISPTGQQNADKLVPDTSNITHSVNRSSQSIVGGIYSVFAKADGYNWIALSSHPTASPSARSVFFNLSNGTIGTTAAGIRAKIENYGNGWYRCSISEGNSPSTIWTVIATNADNVFSFAGNGNDGVLIWGGQNEQGAYPTSYIPTTTAAVTRLADTASKTGVSSLIGQTEGTLFLEVSMSNWESPNRLFAVSDGTTNNRIVILQSTANRFRVLVSNNNVAQADFTGATLTNGNYKLALAYAENDFILYVNGALAGSDLSGTVPSCSDIYLGKSESPSPSQFLSNPIAQAALFPTRLTNAQLAQLTTL